MNCLVKKAIAECFGTFVLVFFAVGTAIISNSLVAGALAFGLVIVAMAFTIGRISGCHINPAVSLGCLIAKRMTVKEFLVYVCAQIVGGILGAVVLFGIFKSFEFGLDYGTIGSNFVPNELKAKPIIGALAFELILTFVFVYVILTVTDEKADIKFAGIIIGLTLTLVHLIGINITGTSVNPARSIGTAFANLVFDKDKEALKHLFVFILAPLAGGALAAVGYKFLHGSCCCGKCEAKNEKVAEASQEENN